MRKLCTMYGEAKIKGVYISLRPTTITGGGKNLTLVGAWDRSYKVGRGPINTALTSETAYMYLQQAASDQGRRPLRYWGDTHIDYNTKCVAHSLQEKTAWFDTEVNTTQSTQTILDTTYTWRNFGFRQLDQSGSPADYFQPCFWFSYFIEGADNTKANVQGIDVSVKYFISFRQPGMVQTPMNVQEILLLRNTDMVEIQEQGRTVPMGDRTFSDAELVKYVMVNTKLEDPPLPDEAAVASAKATTFDMPKPTKIARTDSVVLDESTRLL